MAFKYPNSCLIVFCKAPIVGQVNTRLTPDMSAEQATDVHRQLTHRLLSLLTGSDLCPVELWCSPDTQHVFFKQCENDYPITLHNQSGPHLGIRMHHALSNVLERYQHALLLGCDCPSLTIGDLEQAIKALMQGSDITIAPAEDGGYVMIGMSRPHQDLFDGIEWGKDTVLAMTEKRIEEQQLDCYKTARQWDIDTIKDWQRFVSIETNRV